MLYNDGKEKGVVKIIGVWKDMATIQFSNGIKLNVNTSLLTKQTKTGIFNIKNYPFIIR